MTKSIKGTQTEKNLLTSFAGESQARMRYTYYMIKNRIVCGNNLPTNAVTMELSAK